MAQIAQTLERLLSQLPPAIQRAPTSGVETLTEFEQRLAGLTLAEKTAFYAAELNTPSPVRITPEEQAILDARVDRILDGILLRRDPGYQPSHVHADPDDEFSWDSASGPTGEAVHATGLRDPDKEGRPRGREGTTGLCRGSADRSG